MTIRDRITKQIKDKTMPITELSINLNTPCYCHDMPGGTDCLPCFVSRTLVHFGQERFLALAGINDEY